MHTAPSRRGPRIPLGLLSLTFLVALGLAAPAAMDAQDVRYREVTTTEFAGFMGSAKRMAGEDMGPDTTVNWIKGLKLRVDQADRRSSAILDLEAMQMTSWHHVDSTYWVMRFSEATQIADSSIAETRDAMTDEERRQMGSFTPTLDVDRTGETRTINGWEAERVVMTLTLEAAQDAMSEEQMQEDPMAAMMGTSAMVMLTDMWISDDVPGYEQIREALGDESADFATGSGGMESLMAGYPQMAALAEQMQEEMQGLEGQTVRSTAYLLMMPAGGVLNRDSILEMSDEPLPQGPDLSELMSQAMRSAGEDAAMGAVSNALGGLGGLLRGRRDDRDEEEQAARMAQMNGMGGPQIMSRIVTEIIEVESLSLSESDFLPPPHYREREWPGRERLRSGG